MERRKDELKKLMGWSVGGAETSFTNNDNVCLEANIVSDNTFPMKDLNKNNAELKSNTETEMTQSSEFVSLSPASSKFESLRNNKEGSPEVIFNPPPSLFFSDGKRHIDFVLVYKPEETNDRKFQRSDSVLREGGSPQKHSDKRRIFENNLKRLGLELEYASAVHSNHLFVLIHAPFPVLLKQAEVLNIKMPVYQNDIIKHSNLMDGAVNIFLKRFRFLDFDDHIKKRIEPEDYFTQPFIAQHLESFLNHENKDKFFSVSDRCRMVYDFLIRTRYDGGNKEKFRFGIDRLVESQTYLAAYPLHERFEENVDLEKCSDRQLLYEVWVKMKNICKYQPLHLIKEYFGTKIGFYFAWLGYYTRFLYVISVLGFLCLLYGILTYQEDIPTQDICEGIGTTALLCPACRHFCDFTPLSGNCVYSKLTYIFDNPATIVFAIVMSIWTTLFLEGWKRYHCELAYKWNVLDFETEQEVMRPQFQYSKGRFHLNPVTQQREPHISFVKKFFRICGSAVVVLFFLSLVLALVIGIVVYRVIVMQVFYTAEDEFFQDQAVLITSVTAACINLFFILIMNYFYDFLALKLTEWEFHRTQTEFDNSYTLKVFLFQFINFYSSLFYIAFVKGRFPSVPDYDNFHSYGIGLFKQRLEDCSPAGCRIELVIQLFIIMVGKQAFNALAETVCPVLIHRFRRWQLRLPSERKLTQVRNDEMKMTNLTNTKDNKTKEDVTPLFEKDYSLTPVSQQFLFYEYLEIVIQFGFVTLFAAAFPLAPLFALINNIFEIRLDAYKLLVETRRPIPIQAKNIGMWFTILDLLNNFSVLCSAFVIAFTSDFIPKLYYWIFHGSLYGYMEDSLSYFDARNIQIRTSSYANVTLCRFRDYRKAPCGLKLGGTCSDDYEFEEKWWIILSLRLVFVLIFEISILSIKAIFAYIIPDVPSKITTQLQREKYLSRQAILQRNNANSFRSGSIETQDSKTDTLKQCNDIEDIAYQIDEDLVGNEKIKQDNEMAKNSSDQFSFSSLLNLTKRQLGSIGVI